MNLQKYSCFTNIASFDGNLGFLLFFGF